MNILEKANDFTTKDRNTCYDEPENNFQRIADYWKVHIKHKIELEITRIDKFSLLKNHLYILYELIDWIVDPALVARLCQFIKIGRKITHITKII